MHNAIRILYLLLLFLNAGCQALPAAEKSPSSKEKNNIKVSWDKPEWIAKGGYPRVHRLNDGRLMMSYSASANNYVRFSDDNGYSWSDDAQVVMKHFIVENEAGKAKVLKSNAEIEAQFNN